jgi:Rha family phage regulatory protein
MEHLPFDEFVVLSGTKLLTDSRRVAKHFGKRHADVLRSIKLMDCSDAFRERNFALTSTLVASPKGGHRKAPVVTMTKDGFVFLAMGFTGKDAARLKEAYIGALNAMAEQMHQRDQTLWQQMQALIAKEVDSKVRASFGAHLMLQRKRQIPSINRERDLLERQLQPHLFSIN